MTLTLGDFLRDALQTAFRAVPWPVEPGLRRSGEPGPDSPVIVTGNYDLTVRRVLRALAGVDAWVVVAPSNGINVWCAAAGGHLTSHQVVTALKTSGVERHVEHHRAILPQLAATGVMAGEVRRRCGWRVRFGPADARDLPRYLTQGGRKSDDMRHVRFGLKERLEMAVAWIAPMALVSGGVAALLHRPWALPLIGLTAAMALAVFLIYDRIPGPRRLVLGGGAAVLALAAAAGAGGGPPALAATLIACVLLTAVLTYDYAGSTPTSGGSHFAERHWRITLDLDSCRGVYRCWEVCPEAVFERLEEPRRAELVRKDRCIRCGACVVQCPTDALYFEDASGRRIEPDVIRRFKLNLLGKRAVDAGKPTE